jgi:hypothetical protein
MIVIGWLFAAAVAVMVARQLPRLIRDVRGPLANIDSAQDDAEPMALVMPNDDGWFTWSLRHREHAPKETRENRRG